MIYKIAEFEVRSSKVDVAKKAIKEFVEKVKENEPDTITYEAFQRSETGFVHFMCFRDQLAEQYHQKTDHVKKFVEVLYPICTKEPVFTDLKLVDA